VTTDMTHCPRCGAIVTDRFCNACGADSQERSRNLVSSILSWMRKHPRYAIWIVLGILAGGFAIVDRNVGFLEKHAPKINAMIHDGEISSEGDATYQGQKWSEDLGKLEGDLKGEGWKAVRQEMLGRKPYLADLVDRNGKIQRRIISELLDHTDQNDACESLAVHEAAPLMDQYTKVEQEFYGILERTETPTKQDSARISAIAEQQDALHKRFSEFGEHWRAKGCK
jgi:hypothetical protein